MRHCKSLTWMVLVLAVWASVAWADAAPASGPEKGTATQPAAASAVEAKPASDIGRGLAIMGCCIGGAFAAAWGGHAIGRIATACLESIARQPEASGKLFAPMVITAAMVEGCILFAVLVALLGIILK